MISAADLKSEVMQSVCEFVNKTPEALSLLYDLDLLPEQVCTVPEQIKLIVIVDMMKSFEKRIRTEAANAV